MKLDAGLFGDVLRLCRLFTARSASNAIALFVLFVTGNTLNIQTNSDMNNGTIRCGKEYCTYKIDISKDLNHLCNRHS